MGGSRLIDRVRGAEGRFRTGGATDTAQFEQIKKDLHNELLEGAVLPNHHRAHEGASLCSRPRFRGNNAARRGILGDMKNAKRTLLLLPIVTALAVTLAPLSRSQQEISNYKIDTGHSSILFGIKHLGLSTGKR